MVKTINKKTGKKVDSMKNTYWLDGWEGDCQSGFYIRSDLFKDIARFEKTGHKVVGITIEPDTWNMEFICEIKNDKRIPRDRSNEKG